MGWGSLAKRAQLVKYLQHNHELGPQNKATHGGVYMESQYWRDICWPDSLSNSVSSSSSKDPVLLGSGGTHF